MVDTLFSAKKKTNNLFENFTEKVQSFIQQIERSSDQRLVNAQKFRSI